MDAAAWKGHERVVRLLLQRGWVNEAHNQLSQSLHFAVRGGWLPIAQILIDHGAELVTKVTSDTCQLYDAVKYGQPDMVKLLLDVKSAEWWIDTEAFKKAYSLAKSRGYTTSMHHFAVHKLAHERSC